MSARSIQGWQTSLADLSLILFMVAAAAVGRSGHEGAPVPASPAAAASAKQVSPSARSEPLAVYQASPDAPPLGRWLAEQADDPRHQLTITARYGRDPGAQTRAVQEAARLLEEARATRGTVGRDARIVVEPGEGPVEVVLGYDAPLARPLLKQAPEPRS